MKIERFESSARMSRVVIHNGVAYLCGQVTKDDEGDIAVQTTTMLEKVDALLATVGSDRSKILSATIYLADMDDFNGMNRVWEKWVPTGCAPARACIQALMAGPELLVEISVIAAV
jgi:enamine deaminase RidA (YjgF/YER057c/UK114 family)